MHLNLLALTCLVVATTALPNPNPNPPSLTARDSLRPRYWDLTLQKPGCISNGTDPSLTLYHRSGTVATSCTSLLTDPGPDGTPIDIKAVDSISWKSPDPSRRYDLCLFRDGECADGTGAVVLRSGWEVGWIYGD
ncbi:hypothetical protein P168DRAFT_300686 [Aspergillus campestris IBT 28561]|uniref:Ecp2 effector protein domain-containing protein n=1 Tax=Aspergillus campestris (strain IBT 28561) TaxID=1392248 RepID=A0A2I1DDC6_ASPC2|nr:uncharacterized protein P168DRAFT_300686 [Aspergillus campestris IBT 28561]PKY07879.1 hypothetical protein P168DRAFT_300686 [Aspergillus campestris IBT 28561]